MKKIYPYYYPKRLQLFGFGKYMVFVVLFLFACEKWNLDQIDFPEVVTLTFEADTNPTEGLLTGQISGLLENSFVESHGHVWSLNAIPAPTLEQNVDKSVFDKKGNDTYQTALKGLEVGNTYYYRGYVIYNNQVIYEKELQQFSTGSLSPILTIDEITPIENGGNRIQTLSSISNLPIGLSIEGYGVVFGSKSDPDITSDQFFIEQGIITSEPSFQFESAIPAGLDSTYLRPFLLVGGQVYYGDNRIYLLRNVWTQVADMKGPGRFNAVAFSVEGKGYVGTGSDGLTNIVLDDFWEYDPSIDSWTQKADFAGIARAGATGFSIGARGYIGLGSPQFPEDAISDFWEYNPSEDTWTRKADFPLEARSGAVGFSIDRKGYVGLGSPVDTFDPMIDFWAYDQITDTWTRKADIPGGLRLGAAAFSIGQMGYLGTGFLYEPGGGDDTDDFWQYDPSLDSWTRKADVPGGGRSGAMSFSIKGKGYIGTGSEFFTDTGGFSFKVDFWEYDPATDLWIQRADFAGSPGYIAVGISILDKGYISSGQDLQTPSSPTDFWEYRPE